MRDRIGEGEEVKKRKKLQESCRRDVENGVDSSGNEKTVYKKVMVL